MMHVICSRDRSMSPLSYTAVHSQGLMLLEIILSIEIYWQWTVHWQNAKSMCVFEAIQGIHNNSLTHPMSGHCEKLF